MQNSATIIKTYNPISIETPSYATVLNQHPNTMDVIVVQGKFAMVKTQSFFEALKQYEGLVLDATIRVGDGDHYIEVVAFAHPDRHTMGYNFKLFSQKHGFIKEIENRQSNAVFDAVMDALEKDTLRNETDMKYLSEAIMV